MNIYDVVSREFRYVSPYHMLVPSPLGDVDIRLGTVFDGASGPMIADMDITAFGPHDVLYRRPVVIRDGIEVRISKFKCDLIYGYRLWKDRRFVRAVVRPIGLALFGGKAWRYYRKKEKELGEGYDEWLAKRFVVPDASCWRFPTCNLDDAVWVGPA
jgi:hypothetical protein